MWRLGWLDGFGMTDATTAGLLHRAFDRARLAMLADWLAVGVVAAMPWSTSIFQIFIVLWLVVLIPTLDVAAVRRELQSPAGGLPVLLWLLGSVGMLWAGIPWAERFAGLGGFNKLLIIPLLLAQFRRSDRGRFVLYGFLMSCVVLLMASTILWAADIPIPGKMTGLPVRDYIAQSTEFLICAFALLGLAFVCLRESRWWLGAAAGLLAGLFMANIFLVATGRTALVVIALLLLLLGFRFFGWKGIVLGCVAAIVIGAAAWVASPFLRERIRISVDEVQAFRTSNDRSPTGERLELLKRSLGFVATAPVIGHGTGSIPDQFRRTAVGEGLSGLRANNPHNQILAVAIQLGVIGVAILLAMWLAHLALFRGGGLVSWTGIVIVVQNLISAPINSHLFDSFHGWLYVFGFGVVGGMALRERAAGSMVSMKSEAP
jgi:O-antigen ligase